MHKYIKYKYNLLSWEIFAFYTTKDNVNNEVFTKTLNSSSAFFIYIFFVFTTSWLFSSGLKYSQSKGTVFFSLTLNISLPNTFLSCSRHLKLTWITTNCSLDISLGSSFRAVRYSKRTIKHAIITRIFLRPAFCQDGHHLFPPCFSVPNPSMGSGTLVSSYFN